MSEKRQAIKVTCHHDDAMTSRRDDIDGEGRRDWQHRHAADPPVACLDRTDQHGTRLAHRAPARS